jgi:hypothetical protein
MEIVQLFSPYTTFSTIKIVRDKTSKKARDMLFWKLAISIGLKQLLKHLTEPPLVTGH